MFRLTSSFVLFLVFGATTTNVRALCDLECPSNAPCRFGEADFSDRTGLVAAEQETHLNGMHCDCPIGWTGILCNQKYETCTNQKGHECYNGGECILGLEDKFGNDQLFCDCTKARGFVGKYCETPFVQRCAEDEVACVNGSSCNPEYPFTSSQPCICDKGWEGHHCQIKKETTLKDDGSFLSTTNYDASPPCDGGHCLNGGVCIQEQVVVREGTGTSMIDEYCDCSQSFDGDFYAGTYCQYKSTSVCLVQNTPQEEASESAFCVHHGDCNSDGSCSCPHGWTGQHCEFKILDGDQVVAGKTDFYMDEEMKLAEVDKCGDSICYNGGSCIETQRLQPNGGVAIESHCDCSTAFDEKYLYAGTSCEFPHTQVCWVPEEGDDSSAPIFCTNHGSCRDTPQLGCDCPLGFAGPACEYELHDIDNKKGVNDIVEVCGDGICHNGGKCVTSTIYNEVTGASKSSYSCDCSSAYDDETAYLGESCEYPATDMCTPAKLGEPLSSARFCVNHGACNQDPSKDCECGDGFEGKFCELKVDFDVFDNDGSDDNVIEEFELCRSGDGFVFPCFNGGFCNSATRTDENGKTIRIGHECECNSASSGADLFAGVSCEYKATSICGDSSFCVNGGTCQQSGVCDCPVPWKGIRCELPMDEKDLMSGIVGISDTDICTIGDEYHGRPLYFCLNGGHCNDKVTPDKPDPGCTCPDNYTGHNCELKILIGPKGLGLIAGLLVALVGVFAFVANYIRKLLLKGRKNADLTGATIDNNVAAMKTTLAPRRYRKAGFGKSARRKSQPSFSSTDEGVRENEGVMKDCSLDDEKSPYVHNHEMVEFSAQAEEDEVDIKLRGTNFV